MRKYIYLFTLIFPSIVAWSALETLDEREVLPPMASNGSKFIPVIVGQTLKHQSLSDALRSVKPSSNIDEYAKSMYPDTLAAFNFSIDEANRLLGTKTVSVDATDPFSHLERAESPKTKALQSMSQQEIYIQSAITVLCDKDSRDRFTQYHPDTNYREDPIDDIKAQLAELKQGLQIMAETSNRQEPGRDRLTGPSKSQFAKKIQTVTSKQKHINNNYDIVGGIANYQSILQACVNPQNIKEACCEQIHQYNGAHSIVQCIGTVLFNLPKVITTLHDNSTQRH